MILVEQYGMVWKMSKTNYVKLLRILEKRKQEHYELDELGERIGTISARILDMTPAEATEHLKDFERTEINKAADKAAYNRKLQLNKEQTEPRFKRHCAGLWKAVYSEARNDEYMPGFPHIITLCKAYRNIMCTGLKEAHTAIHVAIKKGIYKEQKMKQNGETITAFVLAD